MILFNSNLDHFNRQNLWEEGRYIYVAEFGPEARTNPENELDKMEDTADQLIKSEAIREAFKAERKVAREELKRQAKNDLYFSEGEYRRYYQEVMKEMADIVVRYEREYDRTTKGIAEDLRLALKQYFREELQEIRDEQSFEKQEIIKDKLAEFKDKNLQKTVKEIMEKKGLFRGAHKLRKALEEKLTRYETIDEKETAGQFLARIYALEIQQYVHKNNRGRQRHLATGKVKAQDKVYSSAGTSLAENVNKDTKKLKEKIISYTNPKTKESVKISLNELITVLRDTERLTINGDTEAAVAKALREKLEKPVSDRTSLSELLTAYFKAKNENKLLEVLSPLEVDSGGDAETNSKKLNNLFDKIKKLDTIKDPKKYLKAISELIKQGEKELKELKDIVKELSRNITRDNLSLAQKKIEALLRKKLAKLEKETRTSKRKAPEEKRDRTVKGIEIAKGNNKQVTIDFEGGGKEVIKSGGTVTFRKSKDGEIIIEDAGKDILSLTPQQLVDGKVLSGRGLRLVPDGEDLKILTAEEFKKQSPENMVKGIEARLQEAVDNAATPEAQFRALLMQALVLGLLEWIKNKFDIGKEKPEKTAEANLEKVEVKGKEIIIPIAGKDSKKITIKEDLNLTFANPKEKDKQINNKGERVVLLKNNKNGEAGKVIIGKDGKAKLEDAKGYEIDRNGEISKKEKAKGKKEASGEGRETAEIPKESLVALRDEVKAAIVKKNKTEPKSLSKTALERFNRKAQAVIENLGFSTVVAGASDAELLVRVGWENASLSPKPGMIQIEKVGTTDGKLDWEKKPTITTKQLLNLEDGTYTIVQYIDANTRLVRNITMEDGKLKAYNKESMRIYLKTGKNKEGKDIWEYKDVKIEPKEFKKEQAKELIPNATELAKTGNKVLKIKVRGKNSYVELHPDIIAKQGLPLGEYILTEVLDREGKYRQETKFKVTKEGNIRGKTVQKLIRESDDSANFMTEIAFKNQLEKGLKQKTLSLSAASNADLEKRNINKKYLFKLSNLEGQWAKFNGALVLLESSDQGRTWNCKLIQGPIEVLIAEDANKSESSIAKEFFCKRVMTIEGEASEIRDKTADSITEKK